MPSSYNWVFLFICLFLLLFVPSFCPLSGSPASIHPHSSPTSQHICSSVTTSACSHVAMSHLYFETFCYFHHVSSKVNCLPIIILSLEISSMVVRLNDMSASPESAPQFLSCIGRHLDPLSWTSLPSCKKLIRTHLFPRHCTL